MSPATMNFPGSTKIVSTPILTMELGRDNILYIAYRKTPIRTLGQTKQVIDEIKKLAGDRKLCMLVDATYTGETNREIRSYTAEELPKVAKAIAIVSDSALGKMMVNLFFSLNPPSFPVKLFSDQTAAREWLTKYL